MRTEAWTVRRFLASEYFADGVRTTLGVIFPALVFFQLGQLQLGIPISLGALCTSITDAPGPVIHKRNGLLICILVVFSVALLTGFARLNDVLMGAEIFTFCFFFSMFPVYGNRATLLGTAALLAMILVMGLAPADVWTFCFLLAAGGVWYFLLSTLFSHILPYRPAQHALGECIRETATFLKLKAAFYSPATDLGEDYRKVVLQQIVVSEKQDAVRELLLKGRLAVKETTDQGSALVLTFVDVVDLYEQIAAIQYDYEAMRRTLGRTGILEHISTLIKAIADELNEIGWAIQSNTHFKSKVDLKEGMQRLQRKVEQQHDDEVNSLVLTKLSVNMQSMVERLQGIQHYFDAKKQSVLSQKQEQEYSQFVTNQNYDIKKLRDNLTPGSAIFRHSLRVALVCLFGFILTKSIALGHHSYWVLLTIIVILKPAFSLTKQRNYQRLAGTIIGGVLGVAVLAVVENEIARFVLLVIFMVLCFSFQRINYIVSVIFMTPFILIVFDILGGGEANVAQERIIDTLIGSAIAFAASYLLFPNWESDKLQVFLKDMVLANSSYLQKVAQRLAGEEVQLTAYKLARKEVYVSAANLSAAFQRMLSEPKRKQRNVDKIHSFLVLNHILSSNIASVASALHEQQQAYPSEYLSPINKAVAALQESLKHLGSSTTTPALETSTSLPVRKRLATDDILLKGQLEFIQKISLDICKTTEVIVA